MHALLQPIFDFEPTTVLYCEFQCTHSSQKEGFAFEIEHLHFKI